MFEKYIGKKIDLTVLEFGSEGPEEIMYPGRTIIEVDGYLVKLHDSMVINTGSPNFVKLELSR